jgi:hypothetical protein
MNNDNRPTFKPYTDEQRKLMESLPARIKIREMIRESDGDQAADEWYDPME